MLAVRLFDNMFPLLLLVTERFLCLSYLPLMVVMVPRIAPSLMQSKGTTPEGVVLVLNPQAKRMIHKSNVLERAGFVAVTVFNNYSLGEGVD